MRGVRVYGLTVGLTDRTLLGWIHRVSLFRGKSDPDKYFPTMTFHACHKSDWRGPWQFKYVEAMEFFGLRALGCWSGQFVRASESSLDRSSLRAESPSLIGTALYNAVADMAARKSRET